MTKLYAGLGIAFLAALYTTGVYYAGGVKLRAELKLLVAQVAAKTKEIEDKETANRAARDTLITEKDKEREKANLAISTAWAAELERQRVRNAGPGGRGAKEPVRFSSGVCHDAAADQRLSDAVSTALGGYREGFRRYRLGVAELLETCERQTGDLINVQSYLSKAKVIFFAPAALP